MKNEIPGKTQVTFPSQQEASRLQKLSPFVRQAGDGIRNNWCIEGRKLFDYLLVYSGSGSGTFTLGEDSFRVEKGDFTWVPPDTFVRMEGDPVDMRVVYIHFDLLFDPKRSRWDAIIPGGLLDLSRWSRHVHPEVEDPAIKKLKGKLSEGATRKPSDLLIQICFEYNRASEPDHLFLSGLTLQLITELINLNATRNDADSIHWKTLAEAEEYIHTHLNTDLNVSELSERFRLSTSHFRKIFRERFGTSPARMHRELRIKKGCELLVYSDMNVSETAYELGFSSVHSFSKTFKKITGISPTGFKKGQMA